MPTCCICNRELPRAAFSKSQLKRKDTRKCLECLAGHHSSHRDDSDEPFLNDRTSIPQEVIDSLVNAFLEPNRLTKVPADLRSRDALSLYFRQLFCQINSTNSWLVEPLIKGLLRGQTHINKRVTFPVSRMEPFPLLLLVVQWKHIRTKFLFGADEKLVALVLAAGANVNAITHRTKINAAFFAVKYASLDTLKLLAGAGIDMQHRDSKGRTCFYQALERCDPFIIRYLLDDKSGLDVIKQFLDIFEVVKLSAPDHILSHFSNPTFDENGGAPVSWKLVGPPPIQDIAETLILLRQRGATFTGANRHAWDCIGLAVKGEGDGAVYEPRLLAQLYSSLLGLWLPPSIQKQIDEQYCRGQEQESQSPEIIDGEDCKLCLDTLQKEGKGGKRAVRLYCDHAFCQDCILEYGKKEFHCPVCDLILCQDVVGKRNSITDKVKTSQQARLLGLRHLDSIELLTKDQVIHEARTRKMYKSHQNLSIEQIKEKIINDDKNDLEFFIENREEALKNARFLVELSATDTLVGVDSPTTVFAPKNGPAMIEIAIKGIPVVARLSNNTTYTCVSASVVKAFNLKKVKSLRSSQFRDALSAERIRHFTFTCLDDFCFSIGGIQVKLGNAVECKPDLDGAGVQLGEDFFRSARWCVVGVRASPGVFFRVNHSDSWAVQDPLRIVEEEDSLRYYSHNDEIAHLPLLYCNPHKSFRAPVIALDNLTHFVECNWCCRIFPLGMLQCTTCQEALFIGSYYCDRRCQRAGWELHKITSEGHSREEMVE